MINRILENEDKTFHELLDTASRNIDFLRVAAAFGKEQDVKNSTIEVCQSMADIWNKKKYTINDIEDMFQDYYILQMKKGYTVDFFQGETRKDVFISTLLDSLDEKTKECEVLKAALRIISNGQKNY